MNDWVVFALQRELDGEIAMIEMTWLPIRTLETQDWLQGECYKETEVIFCDDDGAYCGVVVSGNKPKTWVTLRPENRKPTNWCFLPYGI